MENSPSTNQSNKKTDEYNPIDIQIDDKSLFANLTLIPSDGNFKGLTAELVNLELGKKGIVYGIQEKEKGS